MNEAHPPRVQCDAAIGLTTSRAVFHIAFDGMPGSTQLCSDLVERTALGHYLQQ
ncbi:MAG: hypothetical protein IPI95_16840 [Flavobacteriales bacterium]|nr:hypothetical protein [Flavobacteriales bacterium]